MKYCYIDFEYTNSSEEKLKLVSCAYSLSDTGESFKYWLYNDSEMQNTYLYRFLWELNQKGYIFVAYAVTAEASSFYSLGLDPTKFKWIDLYLEYRCLTNHNHNFAYGKQLLDGKVKTTKPPKNKWQMSEEERESASSSKPQHGLAAACFKVLGEKVDTDFKDHIRDIIIADEEILENKDEILRYNESDIQYLPRLMKGILNEYGRLLTGSPKNKKLLKEEMLRRGEYAARTALMERVGYPIDLESTRAFSESVNGIVWALQSEINELFPTILPFTKKPNRSISWSHVRTRAWIEESGLADKWLKTNKGALSLKLDAFKQHFNYRHDFPKDSLGAQMVRYLGIRKNLNGFLHTGKKKKNFWDSVGTDGRVRPYFGIYGAQSARSQPSATGFIFLKSAWMRVLCQPDSGKAIAGIDYKSQEFLIAALMSRDMNMVKAYESGDVYLYLAKLAGEVPWNGKREDYEEIRNIFKVVTLALQFGMGEEALSKELTNKLGKPFTVSQSRRLINLFNRSYRDYTKYRVNIIRQYRRDKFIKLPCGWYMWGDNDNAKSAGNVPIQGQGSSIMRKAVALAQDRGLTVIKTLHDALYIEYDVGNENDMNVLGDCMKEAFSFYFQGDMEQYAKVNIDLNCWSPDYDNGYLDTEHGRAKMQSKYIDDRSISEYEKWKPYFEPEEFNL